MSVVCRALFLRVAMRQALALHVPCPSLSKRDCGPLYSKLMSLSKPNRFGFSGRQYSNSTLELRQENASSTNDGRSVQTAEEILNSLSPEMEKKLKVIKLEYEVMLHLSEAVPEKMTASMWVKLLECETKSARRRLHRYLRSCEKHDLAKERKKKLKRELREAALQSVKEEKSPLNTIFLRLRKKTILRYHNSKLANAMLFGEPLVIDLSFEDTMQEREIINLAEQILHGHGSNKTHKDPFHIIVCNVKKGSKTLQSLQSHSLNLPIEEYMFTITEQSYLDMYPRDRLVYLTPNAPQVMRKYDHNKVYIIGGIVDKSHSKPLTLAKAKREGIAMAKLPLDHFHKWEKGTKSLTIDQMVKIMLDIQLTQDWHTAFQHIPNRKIVKENIAYGRMY